MSSAVLSRNLTLLLAFSVGALAANLYYAQPLVAMISAALGLAPAAAGLVVTFTQAGYGLGVLLAVPLGDVLENKKLILTMIGVAVLGLLGLAFSTHMIPYFIAAFATGLGTSTVQIIVPYSAHLVPEERRGETMGRIMSGLMLGIMASRPLASLLSDWFSWHAVFVLSATLMIALAALIARNFPVFKPTATQPVTRIWLSLFSLFVNQPVLRRRAFYQACLFGAFCLFWTTTPLLLATTFGLSQTGIAIFAIVGIAGAISAPIAGVASDRGLAQMATTVSLVGASLSFALSHFFAMGSLASLIALGVSAVLLDAGVSAHLVTGQRIIFALDPASRGRLNALYIATIFVGGSAGSALGVWAYARGGWDWASLAGFILPAGALAIFATERRGPRKA